MRFCENCGDKVSTDDKFCSKCGKVQKIDVNKEKPKNIKVTKTSSSEGLGVVSMVLGIISFVFSFIINLFIVPVALIGLTLGIVNKASGGKKVSGIVLNLISIFISITVFIIWIVLLVYAVDKYDENSYSYTKDDYSFVVGTWNCKNSDSVLNDDYDLTLTVNDDKTFMIGDNNKKGNFIKGIYYFEDNDLNSFVKGYDNHVMGLNPVEKYENGDLVDKWDDTYGEYKMVIVSGKNNFHTVLTDEENDKVYYCNK